MIRFQERGTKSHNTVNVENKNQSEMWGLLELEKEQK